MTSSFKRRYNSILATKTGTDNYDQDAIGEQEIEIMDKDGNKIMLSIEQIQLLEALAK